MTDTAFRILLNIIHWSTLDVVFVLYLHLVLTNFNVMDKTFGLGKKKALTFGRGKSIRTNLACASRYK